MIKTYMTIRIFAIAYVFLLPYLLLGVKVGSYSFSISDLMLSMIFLISLAQAILCRKILMQRHQRNILILYSTFLAVSLLSCIINCNNRLPLAEFLTLFYPLMLLFSFFIILYKNADLAKAVTNTYILSSIFSIVVLFGILFNMVPKYVTLFSMSNKYKFFTNSPNQFAMYLLIGFALYVFSRIYCDKENNKLSNFRMDLILPAGFLITTMSTGSRTAVVIMICLVSGFFVFMFFKRKKIPQKIAVVIAVLLTIWLTIGISSSANCIKRVPSLTRWTRVFDTFAKGRVVDKGRADIFSNAMKEFHSSPVMGIGVGKIKVKKGIEAHNSFLSMLAEMGIVGFSCYIVLISYIIGAHAIGMLKHKLNPLYSIILFLLLLTFNFTHYVARERWVWFFLVIYSSFFWQPDTDMPVEKAGYL